MNSSIDRNGKYQYGSMYIIIVTSIGLSMIAGSSLSSSRATYGSLFLLLPVLLLLLLLLPLLLLLFLLWVLLLFLLDRQNRLLYAFFGLIFHFELSNATENITKRRKKVMRASSNIPVRGWIPLASRVEPYFTWSISSLWSWWWWWR